MSAPRASRRARLAKTIRAHPVLALSSLAALVICAMFLLRLGMLLWTGGPEAWAQRPVEGWMTPGYLVRVYDLPQQELSDIFGVAPGTFHRQPLSDIAQAVNRPLPELIALIEALRAQ